MLFSINWGTFTVKSEVVLADIKLMSIPVLSK